MEVSRISYKATEVGNIKIPATSNLTLNRKISRCDSTIVLCPFSRLFKKAINLCPIPGSIIFLVKFRYGF